MKWPWKTAGISSGDEAAIFKRLQCWEMQVENIWYSHLWLSRVEATLNTVISLKKIHVGERSREDGKMEKEWGVHILMYSAPTDTLIDTSALATHPEADAVFRPCLISLEATFSDEFLYSYYKYCTFSVWTLSDKSLSLATHLRLTFHCFFFFYCRLYNFFPYYNNFVPGTTHRFKV